MKPVLYVVLFLGLTMPAFSAAPEVDFDGNSVAKTLNSAPQDIEGVAMPIITPAPQAYTKEANLTPRPLSDLIGKCPRAKQTEFYKSLVFVKGNLGSINIESIKGCSNSSEVAALVDMPGKPWFNDSLCRCNSWTPNPNHLMCYDEPVLKCNTGACNGSCKADSSKFAAGYLNMADVFLKVPEDTAREFAGSLILNEGKVEGYYYGGISRHLDTDKTKAILGILTEN